MYRYTTPTIPITIDDIDFSEVNNFRIKIREQNTEMLFVVRCLSIYGLCTGQLKNIGLLYFASTPVLKLREGHHWPSFFVMISFALYGVSPFINSSS